jgi:two-component system, chemotaxis family, protein-glutamate methylesterase/glutaminase
MAHRDIIVVGTSLGGFEVPRWAAGVPADLPASVLVVQHISPHEQSYLAERLDRAGPLRASAAIDGERIEHGHIYVAVPDRHLMLEDGRIRLSRGPKESHARPSVDVLFRSAAVFGGPRVIGVVLTGQLDDGTAGLWAIKDRGGIAIVQSPQEAQYPSMPDSARRQVEVDYSLHIADMPPVLNALTREVLSTEVGIMNRNGAFETRIAMGEKISVQGLLSLGRPSMYTCPDCHGSMVAIEEGPIRRFRCHTGHGFSERALLDQSTAKIEETLWAALAQVEEREALIRELVDRNNLPAHETEQYRADAADLKRMGEQLRTLAAESIFKADADESGDNEPIDRESRGDCFRSRLSPCRCGRFQLRPMRTH